MTSFKTTKVVDELLRKCCDNDCKTPEEMLRNHMIPIEIIGCHDEEIQLAHFKAMKEIFKKDD